ncbi:hypothetical protein TSMEX_010337 [Taenia solium]|eukprot:TsM_000286100 transcript=TsM_000286100 gene=TsM_000286100
MSCVGLSSVGTYVSLFPSLFPACVGCTDIAVFKFTQWGCITSARRFYNGLGANGGCIRVANYALPTLPLFSQNFCFTSRELQTAFLLNKCKDAIF